MSTVAKRLYTPDEYLALERAATYKSEFYRGEIFAIAGASYNHNRISANILTEVGSRLKQGTCAPLSSDQKVFVQATGLYTYPDFVVVCGQPQFHDTYKDVVLNPKLVVEVLSPSTEAYDRGVKFRQYATLESLVEYVLVSQDRVSVECLTRHGDGQWLLAIFDRLDQVVRLASINCDIPLADIYAKIEFDSELPAI